jgi:hypothetical protein
VEVEARRRRSHKSMRRNFGGSKCRFSTNKPPVAFTSIKALDGYLLIALCSLVVVGEVMCRGRWERVCGGDDKKREGTFKFSVLAGMASQPITRSGTGQNFGMYGPVLIKSGLAPAAITASRLLLPQPYDIYLNCCTLGSSFSKLQAALRSLPKNRPQPSYHVVFRV